MRIFNFHIRRYLLSLFVIFVTALSGCASPVEQISFERQALAIDGRDGRITLIVELAITPEQRERGLMFRETLNDGEGMIFIFEHDQILSFWMKNTIIPLSIAYILYNGTIVEIFDLEPGNLNPVRSSRSVRYALEVPQNWFNRAGIGPGDRVDIQSLR